MVPSIVPKLFYRGLLPGLLALFQVMVCLAQEPQLEEVVVTALKRSSSLQDTPISVSALTGDTLRKIGADGFLDFVNHVPGLTIVDEGPGFRRLVIRGVQGVGEAQVGLYYDEIPVTGAPSSGNNAGASQPDFKLFDVERVEVLRGPQGTLYGAGSMGGTVRVIANKPDPTKSEALTLIDFSSTEHGGLGYQVNGMVNIPIVKGRIAARAIAFYEDRDGFIDNARLGLNNINDHKVRGGRFSLRFDVNEQFNLLASAYAQRTDLGAPNAFSKPSGDLVAVDFVKTNHKDNFEMFNLTGSYDFEWGNLLFTSSYYHRKTFRNVDTTEFLYGLVGIPAPPLGSPTPVIPNLVPAVVRPTDDIDSWSHEIRLSSSGERRFKWTIGGFYQDRKSDLINQVLPTDINGDIPSPPFELFTRTAAEKLKQKAVFGELSYDVLKNLTLTVGARYFDVQKVNNSAVTVGFGPFAKGPGPELNFDDSGTLLKFHGAYYVNDNAMIYAQAAEGFRVGGANQKTLAVVPEAYGSDSLWSYEIGTKTSWLDKRLNFNVAVYYIDWQHIQTPASVGPFNFIANAGGARIKGIEVEVFGQLSDSFSIDGNLTISSSQLTDDQNPAFIANPGRAGDSIPYVPDFTASLSTEYERPVFNNLQGLIRADMSYTGNSASKFNPADINYEKMNGYFLLQLKAGVVAADWSAYLFLRNVFDERAEVRILSDQFRAQTQFTVQPRTIGLTFTRSF